LLEEEIRPKDIFDNFLKLADLDIQEFFLHADFVELKCPACEREADFAFIKKSFSFMSCPNCLTLFVSPRPDFESFKSYYSSSRSTKYWSDVFYKKTANTRREKIWKKKAKLINDIVTKKFNSKNYQIYDIGGGFGIFAEEYAEISNTNPIIIEPSRDLAQESRKKGFIIIEKFLEEVKKNELTNLPKVFVSFELFEHLHDPERFLKILFDLLDYGDIFIFTTLSSIGLDIQLLWEKSKSVYPPHHLNFFNPYSIEYLLKKIGFDEIEVTTPGELDLDIISKNMDQISDRFWKSLLKLSNEETLRKTQDFISQNLMSSHMMIVCTKP
jgi:SAM-dependent methyltransferase